MLNKRDFATLTRIVKTNGGGVYFDRIPKAQQKRLFAAGLIRWKPTNLKEPTNRLTVTGMLIHTDKGLQLVRKENRDA